jgi:hypothetical protein
MHAAADDPHGDAADPTAAAATAGVSTAQPTAMVTASTAWRKTPLIETPLGNRVSV